MLADVGLRDDMDDGAVRDIVRDRVRLDSVLPCHVGHPAFFIAAVMSDVLEPLHFAGPAAALPP